MKRFHSFALALLMGAALSSCSSGRYFQFAAHSTSYHRAPVAAGAKEAVAAEAPAPVAAVVTPEPVLTASASPVVEPVGAPTAMRPVTAPVTAPKLSEELTSARAARALTRAQERRYERVLRKVQQLESQEVHRGANIVEVILCLIPFLACIGVYLHEGNTINNKFWIALVLSLLFVLPGVIYGLLVVTDTI